MDIFLSDGHCVCDNLFSVLPIAQNVNFVLNIFNSLVRIVYFFKHENYKMFTNKTKKITSYNLPQYKRKRH